MSHFATQPRFARPRRLPAQQRREHLLDVAAEIVLELGFDALTMESVAERAGVSKGLGYAYFDNAEELAVALYEEEVSEFHQRVQKATLGAESFEDCVVRAIRAYLDLIAERGMLLVKLQTRLRGRKLKRSLRRGPFRDFWASRLEQDFCVERVVAETMASAMLTAADAFAGAWHARRIPRRELENLFSQFLICGIRGALASNRRRAVQKLAM